MLQARLLALRDNLRHRLGVADALDAGLLATLANVKTVLADLACKASSGEPNEASP